TQQFFYIMQTVEKLGIMPQWININFSAEIRKKENPEKTLDKLNTEIKNSEKLLSIIEEKENQLNSYKISNWEDPKTFDNQLEKFKEEFVNFYISEEFFNLLAKAQKNQFEIITLTNLMDKFVDTFDKAIKTLKGSTLYKSDEEKVKNFKTMVKLYLDLFNSWTQIIPENSIQFHTDWPLNNYIESINRIFNDIPNLNPEQLTPSSNFSVNAATLGATTAFERHYPSKLEDLFTLMHQNLSVIINTILKKYCNISLIHKTNLFNNIQNKLLKVSYLSAKPALTSVSFLKDKIIYHYNLPLQQHSLSFNLSMNKNNTVSIRYNFVGEAGNRWDTILFEANFLNKITQTSLYLNSFNDNSMIFTITYDEKSKFNNLINEIGLFIKSTFVNINVLEEIEFIYKLSPEYIKNITQEILKNANLKLIEFLISLLKSDHKESNQLIINFVANIFNSDNMKLKEKTLMPGSVISNMPRAGDENIRKFVIDLVTNIFDSDNMELKEKALMPGSVISNMPRAGDENVRKFVIDLVTNIFNSDNMELKEKTLIPGGVISNMFESGDENVRKFVIDLVTNIFNNKDNELKDYILNNNSFLKFNEPNKNETIKTNLLFNLDLEPFVIVRTTEFNGMTPTITYFGYNKIFFVADILNKLFNESNKELQIKALKKDKPIHKLSTFYNPETINTVKSILKKSFKTATKEQKKDLENTFADFIQKYMK
ncbi:MAG: hypothetical protein ABIA74_04785, partial [bacterium]